MSNEPNGRAGRLAVLSRLDLARHATNLLHNKEEALKRERTRLAAHTERSHAEWDRLYAEAAGLLLRARAMGASDRIRDLVISGPDSATVETAWQMSMGITYPGRISCHPTTPAHLSGTAALVPAIEAYQRALTAGAQHAATTTALDRLDDEIVNTRRRRRAIDDHLIPRLDTELQKLNLALDEQDRDEAIRVRLAANRKVRSS